MAPETLARDLERLKPFLSVQQFFALGGEPLLHPKIVEILDVARASGIAREIGVLTNGSLLDRMPEEFWTKIDILRISVYPKLDPKLLDLARGRSERHKFYLGLDGITVFWKQFQVNPGGKTFFNCPWKGSCWTVHEGHFYLCPQSAFWTDKFLNLPQAINGLPLDENLTEEKLLDYANRKVPFAACSICNSYAVQVPWKESHNLEEWIKESTL
jgi:hypothetical protein